MDDIIRAEIRLPSNDLKEDLPFFTGRLGFRLDQIFPADDPAVAVISGYGLRLRLERGASEPAGTIRLLRASPVGFARHDLPPAETNNQPLTAPNGTVIEFAEADPPLQQPPTRHAFVVRRLVDQAPWVIGRAGMHYRDLIPNRLGGKIIASHIRIPDGGPVPDMVHYHTVGFQLIYCYRGWVRLVYEDQGPAFILNAGDCVIQPPEIRHRVLESSDNLEVIEIGVPAEHITTIDHNMELPTAEFNPSRIFGGQRFCHHQLENARWQAARLDGFEVRDTGILDATGGVANVQVYKATGAQNTAAICSHDSDILFSFLMEGSVTLEAEDEPACSLAPGDAFVIPPNTRTRFTEISADLELLEVSLPGAFATRTHSGWLE
ncbi:cupin [Chromatiales bacterium (ex Bugula neritina AB1)]|nr:cupin [Chromatiales bacterium (ex Bugula neritina AB1)]